MLFLKLNHSCEPNVGFGGNIVLVAMSDIEAGEELSTDYALFDDYEGSMDCNCGRANGRSPPAAPAERRGAGKERVTRGEVATVIKLLELLDLHCLDPQET